MLISTTPIPTDVVLNTFVFFIISLSTIPSVIVSIIDIVMGLLSSLTLEVNAASLVLAILATVLAALFSRVLYMQYFHPLSKFPGPWYLTSFSLVGALISIKKKEPEYLMYLVRKYGSSSAPRFRPRFPECWVLLCALHILSVRPSKSVH
jgi:hypothetical protein